MVRSDGCPRIVVGSLAASLAVLTSPPPETVAVLATLAGALAATLTVRIKGGYDPPAARTSLRVQVSVARTQLHPEPLSAVALRPVGRLSVTVTVPVVD